MASSAATVISEISDSEAESHAAPDVDEPQDDRLAEFRSRFQPPKPAAISRKRSVSSNLTSGNSSKRSYLGRSSDKSASFVPTVRPEARVKEFPGENLTVDAGVLFCTTCREELCLKKSSILSHIKSAKHQKGKERVVKKADNIQTITEVLRSYVAEYHPSGESLPEAQRLFRLRVTHALLEAGVPLSKVEGDFRQLLEEGGHRLTTPSHLRECIPVIHTMFKKNICQELEGKPVSCIFDGSTRLGEAFAVVVRFVSDDLRIAQRLVSLKCLSKSMNAADVSGALVDILMEDLHISRRHLLAAMRDGASVNTLAIKNMEPLFPNLVDVTCFSHTLDRVGENFRITHASEFVSAWVSLFSHSFKARLAFKEQTGINVKRLSKTRWWSRWEVIQQITQMFPDVHGFIASQRELAPATVQKLLAMLENHQIRSAVQLEMAAVVDAGEIFVRSTYNLEGDGPLALVAYQVIKAVQASVEMAIFPQLTALCKVLSPNDAQNQANLRGYGIQCTQPGIQHFLKKFVGVDGAPAQFEKQMSFFKLASFFHPCTMADKRPSAEEFRDAMSAQPVVAELANSIFPEVPLYAAVVEDLDDSVQPLKWWRRHAGDLPNLYKAVKIILLIQPSSAASERVFSLLNALISSRQDRSLEETLEATLMARMNTAKFVTEDLPSL